jgi:hypothetical protein
VIDGAMQRVAYVLACFALAAGAGIARGDGIEVRDLALRAAEEGMVLDADFSFELSPRLVDMVANGVPLYFSVDFELTRQRWYWFDENTASRRLQLGLSYHALTRQYRLATGPLQQTYATLEEALQGLMRVRNWLVLDRTVSFADTDYQAAVRMRLEVTLLPKPFQLSALTSPDLQLESPWKRFTLRSPRHLPAPVESRAREAAR